MGKIPTTLVFVFVFLNNLNFAPLPFRVFLSNLNMKCSQVSHTHEIPKRVSKDLQFNSPFNI
jgi:hypothetical protein